MEINIRHNDTEIHLKEGGNKTTYSQYDGETRRVKEVIMVMAEAIKLLQTKNKD